MPPLQDVSRTGWAVLWPFVRWAGDGEPVVGEPEELRVNLVVKRTERRLPDGTSIVYDGTARVGREVAVGSLRWEGRLDDLPAGTGTFSELDGQLFRVDAYNEQKQRLRAVDILGELASQETSTTRRAK